MHCSWFFANLSPVQYSSRNLGTSFAMSSKHDGRGGFECCAEDVDALQVELRRVDPDVLVGVRHRDVAERDRGLFPVLRFEVRTRAGEATSTSWSCPVVSLAPGGCSKCTG